MWLGTRTGSAGTAILAWIFFLAAAHGSMNEKEIVLFWLCRPSLIWNIIIIIIIIKYAAYLQAQGLMFEW